MKVAHVVPNIADEASGPSYSVPGLCAALAAQDVEVQLHVLNPSPSLDLGRARVVAHDPSQFLPRFGWSWAMAKALREAARELSILHNHSLWMAPNLYPALAIRKTRCRLVCSPRGTLLPAALRRRPWIKRILWACGQRLTVTRATLLHATSEAEERALRALGLPQPIAVIPNGVDVPELRHPGRTAERTVLYLGRVHPIKGIDVLLRAWQRTAFRHPDASLAIAGPAEPRYIDELRALAASLGATHVRFVGPAYGAEKVRLYESASVFTLPSHSENFGVAVAEALAHGVPVIVSRNAPWAGVVSKGCGWWVEANEEALGTAIHEALSLPPERLASMGAAGRDWMRRDFSWPVVAEQMIEAYRWVLHKGDRPDHVHVSGHAMSNPA